MTHSKLQTPWYSEDKFIINDYLKIKQNYRLLNSASVAILYSTISVIDAKIGKWNKDDLLFSM